ncbi:hypothetical protein [Salisediminibacterium selenitireducens]|uniref:Uncharacterized protein n=1 Tax=Bacillus selenitireducens (strain ATCC 700615 / DSM 15326 / MLS10) TaxID=439292 RepID=D6XWR3_BACIE|nr:hypothetical protein [Salisediminibacterium selenitireducens]ADH97905.1 hypothetical protein Bsel_0365 [[Bacillus] selenitireducens MLS10]
MFWNDPRRVVKRKGRRYKRPFEKMYLYPLPVDIHGRDYYLMDYVRMRRPVASAVFSDEEEAPNDVKRAHKFLYTFYRLVEHIQEDNQMKAKVDLAFFRVPLKKMDEAPHESLDEGYAYIDRLLTFQLKFRKIYEDFSGHYTAVQEKDRALTEEDLEIAVEAASDLDATQKVMLHELADGTGVLRTWRSAMEEQGLWTALTTNQQVFFQAFMENEAAMQEEAKKTKHLTYEQLLKKNRQDFRQFRRQDQLNDFDVLRYP